MICPVVVPAKLRGIGILSVGKPSEQSIPQRGAEEVADASAPRRRGRPSRLSREAVVDAALALLADVPLEGFSMALLAKRLGAGVMSLYTYFPSRDALLLAVAEDIYRRFERPPPREVWQDDVRDWMWATVRLFDRYPVAIKLSAWDGHVSPAWLRTWFPIVRLIKRQGLSGPHLAFAVSWFSTASMSFIVTQMRSPRHRRRDSIIHIGALDREDQQLAAALWLDFETIDRDASLKFGFDAIISGLARLVESGGPADPPS